MSPALCLFFFALHFASFQSQTCRTQPFLSATRFNAAFSGNFETSSSDVEGALAAGGNISVGAYTIGLLLSCNGGCCAQTDDNAIAGGSFSWNGGDLMTGNLVYGTTFSNQSMTIRCGTAIKRNSTSFFTTLKNDLVSTSNYLNSLATTGTITVQYSSFLIDLSARKAVNVFKTTCDTLVNNVSEYKLVNGTSSQTVIINVEGTTCSLKSSFLPNDGYWTKVIWNFPTATSLSFGSVNGTVLAPNANINYAWGRLDGQLFGKSFTGSGQVNHYPFSGCIPATEVNYCAQFNFNTDSCTCSSIGTECVCNCPCCD